MASRCYELVMFDSNDTLEDLAEQNAFSDQLVEEIDMIFSDGSWHGSNERLYLCEEFQNPKSFWILWFSNNENIEITLEDFLTNSFFDEKLLKHANRAIKSLQEIAKLIEKTQIEYNSFIIEVDKEYFVESKESLNDEYNFNNSIQNIEDRENYEQLDNFHDQKIHAEIYLFQHIESKKFYCQFLSQWQGSLDYDFFEITEERKDRMIDKQKFIKNY